jgi:serine/threonine protein kinase
MGAVYRATDTGLNREVAIKILLRSSPKTPGGFHRFEREAQALAASNRAPS